MTDKNRQSEAFDRDEEAMARLLRLAGPREPVPDDIEKRVYERVQSEWQTSTQAPESARVYDKVHRDWARRRSMRRFVMPVAMAASVLVAVVLTNWQPSEPARISAGSIARVIGPAAGSDALQPAQRIYVGDRLVTGAGQGISIALINAGSLRLDENTVMAVAANNRFTLESGRVYADTGDFVYPEYDLVIDTRFGEVTDVGTQFAVAIDPDQLDVAVREGRVDIRKDTTELVAVAGDYLTVRNDGNSTLETLAPYDPYWGWAQDLAPAFDIEDKSLLEFLRWAARESGRELVFENDELRMAAMRVDLHGSVADFAPLAAVESVLDGTRFQHRVEPGRIVIEE